MFLFIADGQCASQEGSTRTGTTAKLIVFTENWHCMQYHTIQLVIIIQCHDFDRNSMVSIIEQAWMSFTMSTTVRAEEAQALTDHSNSRTSNSQARCSDSCVQCASKKLILMLTVPNVTECPSNSQFQIRDIPCFLWGSQLEI